MSRSTQIERQAAAWLARRDADGWSAGDQAMLEAWLSASVEHRVAYLRLEAAWQQSARLKALGAGHVAGSLPPRGQWTAAARQAPAPERAPGTATASAADRAGGHRGRTLAPASRGPGGGRRGQRKWRGWLAAASIVFLAATLGWIWRFYTPVEQTSYATAIGALKTVALPDGSQITLSSNTRIRVSYSRAQRKISLQRGEAFFEVAKDADRPFVVSSETRRVIAVGTRFDVRQSNDDLRVVVTQGVVRLEAGGKAGGQTRPTTYLPAGSIALMSGNGVIVDSRTIQDAEQYVNWRSGYLSFHDTPLSNAVAEFNRYNTRRLVIGDKQTAAMHIGGNFRWSNVDAFVRLLELGFPIRAEHRGDTIVLHRR